MKRVISFLLSIVMVISMLPVSAFATDELPEEPTTTVTETPEPSEDTPEPSEDTPEPSTEASEPTKPSTEAVEPEAYVSTFSLTESDGLTEENKCGDNLTWEYDASTGTLTVSGTGAMYDYDDAYSANPTPWVDYLASIKKVVVESGVTTIGMRAFLECSNLTEVELPDTLVAIGEEAFSFSGLTSITIPGSVAEVQGLGGCNYLETVNIEDGVGGIGYWAFGGCPALKSITIPASVTSIAEAAFESCTGLKEIYFMGDAPSIDPTDFYGVEATVYYPAGNSTWTADVMQNYEGTLTWIAKESGGDGGDIDIGGDSMTQAEFQTAIDAAMGEDGGYMELDGSVTLTDDLTIPEGFELILFDGASLKVQTGKLTVNGVIIVMSGASLIVEDGASYETGSPISITVQFGGTTTVSGIADKHMFVSFMASDAQSMNEALTDAANGGYAGCEVRSSTDITLDRDVTIPEGVSVVLLHNLIVSEDCTLTNNGEIVIRGENGLLKVDGSVVNDGTIKGDGAHAVQVTGGYAGGVPVYADGSGFELVEIHVYTEEQLRAAIDAGCKIIKAYGNIVLTDDLTLPNIGDPDIPQAQKLILLEYWDETLEKNVPCTLTVPKGKTLTLNSRLNIQDGSQLIVNGTLVNNVYEDGDDSTDDIGIWCEDGALTVNGTYQNPNGGLIIVTTNNGFAVNGTNRVPSSKINRNSYVYDEEQLLELLDTADDYGFNQICLYAGVWLSQSITIPENTLLLVDGREGGSLNIPEGKTLTNNGMIDMIGGAEMVAEHYGTLVNNGHINVDEGCRIEIVENATLTNNDTINANDKAVRISVLATYTGLDSITGEVDIIELTYMDQAALVEFINENTANGESIVALGRMFINMTESLTLDVNLAIVDGTKFIMENGAILTVNSLTVDDAILSADNSTGLVVNNELVIVNGGYVNISGTAQLNQYAHIYDKSELDVNGTVTNNGYLCVHPGGNLCINKGAVLNDNDNIDHRGRTYVAGTLNSKNIMYVGVAEDEGETGIASLFVDKTGVVNVEGGMNVAASGALDVNGTLDIMGYMIHEGTRTNVRGTMHIAQEHSITNSGDINVIGEGASMVIDGNVEVTEDASLWINDGAEIIVNSVLTNKGNVHVGDYNSGTLTVKGTMGNLGYLCVHPGGTMNINAGGYVNCGYDEELGYDGFLQCNGTVNVDGELDNEFIVTVDNTAEAPAVMNVGLNGRVNNLYGPEAFHVGENGQMNIRGDVSNDGLFILDGEMNIEKDPSSDMLPGFRNAGWEEEPAELKVNAGALLNLKYGQLNLNGNSKITIDPEASFAVGQNARIDLYDGAKVVGISNGDMYYNGYFASEAELKDILDKVHSEGFYGSSLYFDGVDTVTISGELELSYNDYIHLHGTNPEWEKYTADKLILASGAHVVNKGYMFAYDDACIIIEDGATLENKGYISGHVEGEVTGNKPGEGGGVYGQQVYTWEELKDALAEAASEASEENWIQINVMAPIVVPAKTTLTVPNYTTLFLYAELTVPSGSKLVHNDRATVMLQSSEAALTINSGATYTQKGYLNVSEGTVTNKGTHSSGGVIDLFEGATITGISKSKIVYNVCVYDMEDLKQRIASEVSNGYVETYLLVQGDMVIDEDIAATGMVAITVGTNGATVTIPAGVTVSTNCLVVDYGGTLNIEQGGRLNLNDYALIFEEATLNNYGIVNQVKTGWMSIMGTINNHGVLNLLGGYDFGFNGQLNGVVETGALAKLEAALASGDTYNLTEPLIIDSDVVLQYNGYKTINVTGNGAIIVEDGSNLVLGNGVEIIVSNGGRIDLGNGASLNICGSGCVEMRDSSLTIGEDAVISVETWDGAALIFCEGVTEYPSTIDKHDMIGLYEIGSEQELLDVLNNKMPTDGYGDHILVFSNSFTIESMVWIPDNVNVVIRDSNVVTIAQGAYVKFDGLMNVIHGGQLIVNGVMDVCVENDGVHYPSGYINVANNGKLTVNKGGQLNLYWATLNLGYNSTLTNYGTISSNGTIVKQDGCTVVGNLVQEMPKYEGWGVATNLEELKALMADGCGNIEIKGEIVLPRDFEYENVELMLTEGARVIIPEGMELTLNDCTVDLWYGAEVIVAGTLNLNGRTNMGGTLTIEETGVVNNSGTFSMYGTVNNFGQFISDRALMWDIFEDEDGNKWENWTWNGTDPVIPEETTMSQDEFEAVLEEAAKEGHWGWVELYKKVTLERDLVINQPVELTFPGEIHVPEGVTLTVNRVMDFTGGWLEVHSGGTLINNSGMNLYEGDIVINPDATLRTHYLNDNTEEGQHIEVHAGWLNIKEGANIDIMPNDERPNDRIIAYWPQNHDDFNILGIVEPKHVVVNMEVRNQEDLEAMCWYEDKADEVIGHVWSPIYVDHDITTTWNMVLNFNELWDGTPALTIGNEATLTNHGAFFVHEFAEILIEEGATLDNSNGDIWVFGGQIIALDEEGFIVGDRFYREASNGYPVHTEEELRAWLVDNSEGSVELMGDIELTEDLTITNGVHLHIRNGSTLTVREGITLNLVWGEVTIRGGSLVVNGTLNNDVYISVERNGLLDLTNGTFEGWNNIYVSDNGQVLGLKQSEISKNNFVRTEEELIKAVQNNGYDCVEIYVEGDITLHRDLVITSNMWLNIHGEGSLTVADGATLKVYGWLYANGERAEDETSLRIEEGAMLRIENGGYMEVWGPWNINEDNTYVAPEGEIFRECYVSSEEELLFALEHGENLDYLSINGDFALSEYSGELVIPENLDVISYANLTIDADVDLTVNGQLLIFDGEITMENGSLVNNGLIQADGGNLTVENAVAVSGEGSWLMLYNSNMDLHEGDLDSLIIYETTADDSDGLINIMNEISERGFKLSFVTVSGDDIENSYLEVGSLTVPANTILTIQDGLTLVVKDDHTLTNYGVIDLIGYSDLIISERAQYVHSGEDGRIEITWGEGRFLLMNGQQLSNVFVVEIYDDGTYKMDPVDSVNVFDEDELRAAVSSGYDFVYAYGDIVLTEDFTLPHRGEGHYAQACKLILDEGCMLTVPADVTLTLNSRLNIQGGSQLIVQGNLVNNLYDDGDLSTDDVGIWNEDGGLIVDGGSYSAPNGGYIYMTTNYGAYVYGVDTKLVCSNTYIYSEAELRNALEVAPQYGYNQIVVEEDIILTKGVTVPANALVNFYGANLTIPTGMTLINWGMIEVHANDVDPNKEVTLAVAKDASLYNYGIMEIGDDGTHAVMVVDAGGKFYNYGVHIINCSCDRVEKHFDNKTILVTDITASVNGNTENVVVGLNTPIQLTASVQPAKATQKEVEWKVKETGEILKDGILTVTDLDGQEEMTLIIVATATDGSEVYDELTVTVKEYKVSAEITGESTLTYGQKTTLIASCQTEGKKVVWSLKEGDEQFATLTVDKKNSGKATLTAKTLTEKRTVTVYASSADGTETPAELPITILPKVQKVSILRCVNPEEEIFEDVTGLTINHDLGNPANRDDENGYVTMDLMAVINPIEALGDVKWSTDDSKNKIATVEDGVVSFTGATGTVKITATAQDGSKVAGSVTIKVVDLIQELEIVDKADELIGGKSFTFTAFEVEGEETVGKKLDKSKVKWSLADKDAPFASIDDNGKLTTKKVMEKVTLTVTAEVIGNETVTATHFITVYPLTTQVEIMVGENKVNDLTILLDRDSGKAYLDGKEISRANGAALQLDTVLFPNDVMPSSEDWSNIKWSSSNTKVATITTDGMLTGVLNKDGTYKTGTVTITAAANDGSGKKATVKVQIGTFAQNVEITNPDADGVLRVGESVTLKAVTTPEKPTTSGVTWSLKNTDDSAYVKLDTAKGKVTANTVYEKHTVTIVATSKDGMASAEISIDIMPKASYVLNVNDGIQIITGQTILVNMLSENTTVNLLAELFNVTEDVVENYEVTWSSSNTSIAAFEVWDDEAGDYVTKKTVTDSEAAIKLLKSGTATITIKATDPGDAKKTLSAKITIKATNLVDALEIESKTETFTVASGKALNLTATAFPTEASTKSVTWSLLPGGEEFATINSSGKLTAKANLTQPATVTVVATAKDGSGATAEQEIQILPLVQGLDIWMKDMGVVTNTTLVWDMVETPYLTVNADTYPEVASQDVTWKSSNAKIASIDAETGVITCLKAGTVTITATAADGSGKAATFKLTVVKQMTSLSLENQVIAGGKTLDLSKLVEILESDTTNKKLTWTMSGTGDKDDGTAFATLSSAGKLTTETVTGTKKVIITVTSTDGSELEATCEVTIRPAVTKVNIYDDETLVTGKTITLGVGENLALSALNDPDGALQDWTWSSSNAAVTVDASGMVTAVTAGKTVTITAKATDGSGKSATVKIKTIQKMEELILPATDIVASTKSITLKPEIAPANTTTKTVKWSIVSGSEYASIDKNGKLTAKKLAGNDPVYVNIMVASTDGSELAAVTKVMITPLTTKVHIWDVEGTEMIKTAKLYIGEGAMYLTGSSDPDSAAQTYSWSVSNAKYAGFVVEGEEDLVAKTTGKSVALKGLVPGKTVTVTATADDGSGKKASFKVTTVQRMQELTLDDTAVLGEGKSMTLRANVWPANTSNKNLTWELVSGHDYVTLSAKGVLKAKSGVLNDRVQVVDVMVSSTDGSDLSAMCQITIHPLTKSVDILSDYDSNTITLDVNDDHLLDVWAESTYADGFEMDSEYNWTISSGGYAAFVNEYGETVTSISAENVSIKALKPGKTVTVTATAKDGSGKKDTIKVKTVQSVTGVSLPENQVVTPGKSITLKAKIEPANATDKALLWEIVDGEEYANITNQGVLSAKRGVEGRHEIKVQVKSARYDDVDPAECIVILTQRTTKITLWNDTNNVTGKTVNLFKDQPLWITADSDPDHAHTEFKWTVSNAKQACFIDEETGEEVSQINAETVQLRALESGKTVTVTAAAMDGSGKKASFKVKTMQHVEEIIVEDRYMVGGRSIILDSVIQPDDASNKKVTYEFADGYDHDGNVVLLGNLLFARRTDYAYGVELVAVAQDGSGATANFYVVVYPEASKGVNIYDGDIPVKDVYMEEGGDPIWLYGNNVNRGMAAITYEWLVDDVETVSFIYEDEIINENGEYECIKVEVSQVYDSGEVCVVAQNPGVTTVKMTTLDGSNKTATVRIHVAAAEEVQE